MKDILVFGTGKYFEYKKDTIGKKYNVISFIDNKVEAKRTGVYGDTNIKIINPSDINMDDNTEIFLMSVHFVSMWKQLCEIGINPARLVFPYAEEPFFENDDSLSSCLEQIVFHDNYFECILKDNSIVKIANQEEWRLFLRNAYRRRYPMVNAIASMDVEPVSRQFGTERGTPIDRYYIDKFLSEHCDFIVGDVLEIEDNTYTKKYGGSRVEKSIVMDVSSDCDGVTFNGNLETGEGIRDGIANCFICTQTLMYIYDLKSAAHNIFRLLKKGGTALITCSGISQNSIRCMDNYGCYFNFNTDALRRMFGEEDDLSVVEVGSFGNVKTVSAHINGLCCEDLKDDDFRFNDQYYPLIVYVVVKKDE